MTRTALAAALALAGAACSVPDRSAPLAVENLYRVEADTVVCDDAKVIAAPDEILCVWHDVTVADQWCETATKLFRYLADGWVDEGTSCGPLPFTG